MHVESNEDCTIKIIAAASHLISDSYASDYVP